MIAYTKIRINVASNGAFKANAVMTKDENGRFRIISDTDVFNAGTHGTAPLFSTALFATDLPGEDAAGRQDSFVTKCLLLQGISPFSRYTYETVGESATWTTHDATLDYMSLFEDQVRANASIGGVAIKEGYSRTATYTGMGSYHSYQRNRSVRFNTPLTADKPWKIGVELELYARTATDYDTIVGARSNWFQCEHDGSLSGSYGIEMKTIPLNACDAKSVDFWAAPMARLKELAVSKGRNTTGLHVHIGKEILGNNETEQRRTLDKLTWFYYYLVEDIPANHAKNVAICGRERGYGADLGFGKTPLAEFAKEVGFENVTKSAKAFDQMAGTVREAAQNARHDINLGHLHDYGTVEFRKGKGCIGKTRMAAIVTWWEQMCLYCRNTAPQDLSFETFFDKVTRENPCVAYFFQHDDEC